MQVVRDCVSKQCGFRVSVSGPGTEWKRRKLVSTVWPPLGLSSCRDTGTNKVDVLSSCWRDLNTPVEAVGTGEGE